VLILIYVCLGPKTGLAQTSQIFTFSDGTTESCKTFAGQIAQQVYLPALAGTFLNMGYTGLTIALPNGSARISWDTAKLNSFPPAVHDFIYFHECAHAHVPTSDELMANCVGLIDMRAANRSSTAIEQILNQFHTNLGFMGPRYGIGSAYWAKTVQCANSGGPAIQLNAAAPQTTTTCSFTSGPKAGSVIDYSNQPGVVPAMVGSQCTDGVGSYGMAVPSSASPGSNAVEDKWQGTLSMPQGSLAVVFHLAAGGVGVADSPNQNVFGMPLQHSLTGNHINISVPSVGASYVATVNGNQMSGTFSQNGGNFPLTLTKANSAQTATPPASNGLQGDWQGVLVMLGGNLPLVFHLGAGGSGTADDLLHGVTGMALHYSSSGNKVNVSIPSVGASYSAKVSGNQMSGVFLQNGTAFPLVLTKH
jgi:hypothetical protein